MGVPVPMPVPAHAYPDLSGIGIGVNISYIMQAVLTVVCDPILGLIHYFRHRFGIEV
jgi:hypothetical protein